MHTTLISMVFGFQFMISLLIFIRNVRSIRKMPLHMDVRRRMSSPLRLIPVVVTALVGVTVACVTEYHVSSMVMTMILLPILHNHWMVSPLAVRSVSEMEDVRNGTFRKVMSMGNRSRILTICICLNLFLTYYALFNHQAFYLVHTMRGCGLSSM